MDWCDILFAILAGFEVVSLCCAWGFLFCLVVSGLFWWFDYGCYLVLPCVCFA